MFERDLQGEIAASVSLTATKIGRHVAYYKIPDFPYSQAQNVAAEGSSDKFYAIRKGVDCFLVCRGIHYALELKLVKKGLRIPFTALDEHQEYHLLSVKKAGGYAFVLVNFRSALSAPEQKRRGVGVVNRLFAIDINEWINYRTTLGRASLSLADVELSAKQKEVPPSRG